MKNCCYPFINTPLPYGYNALKPFIDEKTMWLHHSRHLQSYIDNLNKLLKENPELQSWSLEELVGCYSWLPRTLGTAVRNQAGGVYNHRFFFEGMAPGGISLGDGVLAQEMNRTFGGTEGWKERMKEAAMSVFGSGYAWLVWEKNGLEIRTTANQDSPVEVDAEGCRDSLEVDAGDAYLESLGRILQLNVTVRHVCPEKRVALAVILTELDPEENEYQRGMKAVALPAHHYAGCRDIVVRCIKFVLPETLNVSGSDPNSMCGQRKFKVRLIAHNIDTDFRCCDCVICL